MQQVPKCPRFLKKTGRTWFRRVAVEFEFSSSAETELLIQAASTLDTIADCRERIATDGLVVPTGTGSVKPHPCANLERDLKTVFARLCRELRLNEPATDEANRVPRNNANPTRR
jgi:P27 family predicted phage terminase small subunit